jgi:hypothetical protein
VYSSTGKPIGVYVDSNGRTINTNKIDKIVLARPAPSILRPRVDTMEDYHARAPNKAAFTKKYARHPGLLTTIL